MKYLENSHPLAGRQRSTLTAPVRRASLRGTMALWRDTILPFFVPRVAYLYIRLLRLTMRFTFENREVLERVRREHGHYILAFWHSRFVLMPYCYPGQSMNGYPN